MKKFLYAMILLCFSSPAWPEEPPGPIPEGSKGASFLQEQAPKKGLLKRYTDFMDKEIERIDTLDLWGPGSTQLPKGYFSVKYEWNTRWASTRYDIYGNQIPVIPPITLSQDKDNYMILDMRGHGTGGAHTFQLSYGLLGYLDWYVEIPFIYMDVTFDPKYTARGTPAILLGSDLNSFYQTIRTLGRPAPQTHYSTQWDFQDINTGFSFNYFRSDWMSASFTPKVYFPTGKIANPNRALDFLLGPELDRGTGGYTAAFVSDYDLRFPQFKRIMWTLELAYSYAFRQRRPAPTVFTKPDWGPIGKTLDNPVVGLTPTDKTQILDELAQYFPDLSDIGSYYYETPGSAIDASLGVGFDLFVGTLSIGYGYHYKARPSIESSSPAFTQFVYSLQILGESEAEVVSIVFNTPALFALHIPATLQFRADIPAGGRNFLKFEDNYYLTIQTFIPIHPQVMPEPEKPPAH